MTGEKLLHIISLDKKRHGFESHSGSFGLDSLAEELTMFHFSRYFPEYIGVRSVNAESLLIVAELSAFTDLFFCGK